MKVKELIEQLQTFNPESEVKVVVVNKNHRPLTYLQPLKPLTPSIDQDTGKVSYIIDVETDLKHTQT